MLLIIYPGMSIVTIFARRRAQLSVSSDEFYPGCSPEVTNAYLTLVRPKLEHTSRVWNSYTQCSIDKIKMVQRRAARFVYNDYSRFSHVSPMLDALGWDLEHRRFANQMCMFYEIYKGHVAISLPAKVSRNTRVSRCCNCAPFHQASVAPQTLMSASKNTYCPGWVVGQNCSHKKRKLGIVFDWGKDKKAISFKSLPLWKRKTSVIDLLSHCRSFCKCITFGILPTIALYKQSLEARF